MAATHTPDLAKNEAVQILRSQLREAQRLAPEPFIKEGPHDAQVGVHG